MEETGRRHIKVNGNTLKITAIISMVIDHFGVALLETGYLDYLNPVHFETIANTFMGQRVLILDFILRGIGRIAFPIFCFLLTEGFLHTRNVKKYALRLFLFALLSEIPFNLMVTGRIFAGDYQNVYFTLLIGVIVLISIRKFEKSIVMQAFSIILGCCMAVFLKADYDLMGIIIISMFYYLRNNKRLRLFAGAILLAWESIGSYGMAALSILLIHFYSGERGRMQLKYVFYWFYPVHILVLCLIRRIAFGV